MTSSIKYPVQRIINWYYGNFCTRKCFNNEGRMFDCHQKFQQLAGLSEELMMTHKEFKDMTIGFEPLTETIIRNDKCGLNAR